MIYLFYLLIFTLLPEYSPAVESEKFQPDNDSGKIIGGTDAKIADYPYVGSLQRSPENIHMCTVVLITLRHCVTSCRCVFFLKHTEASTGFHVLRKYSVTAGSHMYALDSAADFQIRPVFGVDTHPDCNYDYESEIWNNDIGYVLLTRPFKSSGSIRPIPKLPETQLEFDVWYERAKELSLDSVGYNCKVAGWGFEHYIITDGVFELERKAEKLKEIPMGLIGNVECKHMMCEARQEFCSYSFQTNSRAVCAVAQNRKEGGLCGGDGGVPLFCNKKVLAIGSWSVNCTRELRVSLFQRFDLNSMYHFTEYLTGSPSGKSSVTVIVFAITIIMTV